MKQGSTFYLIVDLNVDVSKIDSVIFTLKNRGVNLTKEDWQYKNGKFEIPFTQEESVNLEGRTLIEAQINFSDGSVAKTQIKEIYIKETLATRIIDGNVATQEGKEFELLVEEDVIYTSEDYEKLGNKPSINGVTLVGDTSLDALNIASKDYVEEEIAKFDFIKIVDALPEVGLPNRIYFVPKSNTSDNDLFDEYAWINEDWEYYGTKQIEVDLTEYVKKTDYATTDKAGVVTTSRSAGLNIGGSGRLYVDGASKKEIDEKLNYRNPIIPELLDYAVKKALSDCKLSEDDAWTAEEKAKARNLLKPNISSESIVLVLFPDGKEELVTLSPPSYHMGNSIARCDEQGEVHSSEPTKASSCATKRYVDDLVGNIETLLGGI